MCGLSHLKQRKRNRQLLVEACRAHEDEAAHVRLRARTHEADWARRVACECLHGGDCNCNMEIVARVGEGPGSAFGEQVKGREVHFDSGGRAGECIWRARKGKGRKCVAKAWEGRGEHRESVGGQGSALRKRGRAGESIVRAWEGRKPCLRCVQPRTGNAASLRPFQAVFLTWTEALPQSKCAEVPQRKWAEVPQRKWAEVPQRKWAELPQRKWAEVPQRKWAELQQRKCA
eukprot:356018-Chlamydomonas_euryale.AAC.5